MTETRRDFLRRAPVRLLGLYLTVTGCSPKIEQPKTELQTSAEKEISETIRLYVSSQKHPEVPKTAAVTLAQAELQGQNPQKFLTLYDKIKEPYKSLFADYGLAANLAYAASKYGYSEREARKLFEASKSGFTLEVGAPSDIAALAMSKDGDISKPQKTFSQIANDDSLKFLGLTEDYDPVSTLTSAALISGFDKTLDTLKRIKETQSLWFSNMAPSVLTLATVLANGDADRVVKAYSIVNEHNYSDTAFGLRVITENGVAVLTLAGTISGRVNESLEMYDFARKTGFIDSDTAVRLVLATAVNRAKLSLISRGDNRTVSTGKGTANYHTIIPIVLSK